MQQFCIDTPAGPITLQTKNNTLISLSFTATALPQTAANNPFIKTVQKEIAEWFRDPEFIFTVPLAPKGTPFQQKIWTALRQIPCGETRTYGELAAQLGTSARAVGNACRANPIALIIPCHRVVAKTGLGGYAGTISGRNMIIKSTLLEMEKKNRNYSRISESNQKSFC